jgi:hypothetical protein
MEKVKVLIRWFASSFVGVMVVAVFAAILLGVGKAFSLLVDASAVDLAILMALSVICMMLGSIMVVMLRKSI